jgi:hypothetical protein
MVWRLIANFLSVACLLLALGSCQTDDPSEQAATLPPRFTLLDTSLTGVTFVNRLSEGPNTNVLVYEYFYNGGGVATGDFDHDGRPDLYFTANMAPNRLYLNRGDFHFEDVTEPSGTAGRPGPWSTGVTVVDINDDGLDDLYLSYSGMLPPDKRRNQLLINQGNDDHGIPTFREDAASYGLDLPAFTNQAYFFDYDRDDDLDVVMLNHNPKSLPILNAQKTRQLLATPDPERGLRLYRNDDGKYTDVTETAGLNGSALSYGLGLALSDLNNDGWIDFYVSNDYEAPDYLYYNNQDGTFTDRLAEQIDQTSHFSMGSDVADINNDGLPDLLTLDMQPAGNRRRKLLMADDNRHRHALNQSNGFVQQTMRNMLHLNRGNGTFAEVGRLAGIDATDWSWSALLADLDNDGWKDLHVTNGYLRDYTNQDFIKYMDDYVATKGRLQRSDVLDLVGKMPASNVSNHVFHNRGDGLFTDSTTRWGLDRPSNSNGAIVVDLDGDGDLDIVTNNINQPAFIYRNETGGQHYLQLELQPLPGKLSTGASVTVITDSITQHQELFPNRGYQSSGPTLLHFGLGRAGPQVQSIHVRWPDGSRQSLFDIEVDQQLTITQTSDPATAPSPPEAPATLFEPILPPIAVEHHTNELADFDRQALLPRAYSTNGPVMVAGDIGADGSKNLIVATSAGKLSVFQQDDDGQLTLSTTVPIDHGEITELLLYDFNRDGAPDLYLAYGGYSSLSDQKLRLQDQILLNDGKGKFTTDTSLLPDFATSTGAVAVTRFEDNEYLFVGGRIVPGAYPTPPASYLLRRTENGRFTDVTDRVAPQLRQLGMVTDATWSDLDADGNPELIIVGEYLAPTIYRLIDEQLIEVTEQYLPNAMPGWWNVVKSADLNTDGLPDLIIGNEGLNSSYTATPEQPLEIYAGDFDGNNQVDPILLHYLKGQRVPDPTRDELVGQLPSLRSTYPNYASYAEADGDELLLALPHTTSTPLTATNLQTTVYLSQPDGRYSNADLPIEAQYAPVHTITVLDANADGHADLLLCGNEVRAKLRNGRSDANAGTLLLGNGRGGFTYLPQRLSGLKLSSAVRAVVKIGDVLLFGRQGAPLEAYRIRPL